MVFMVAHPIKFTIQG